MIGYVRSWQSTKAQGENTDMEYEEIKLLKQSGKSTVHLVRAEGGGEQIYVRQRLAGQHPIYHTLRDCPHPCLPKLYELTVGEDTTTVIE